jgi:hypothetical protein
LPSPSLPPSPSFLPSFLQRKDGTKEGRIIKEGRKDFMKEGIKEG